MSVHLFQTVAEREGRLKVNLLGLSFKCSTKRDYIILWVHFINLFIYVLPEGVTRPKRRKCVSDRLSGTLV